MRIQLITAGLLSVAAQAAPAATFAVYTDRAAFLAATRNASVETFNSQPNREFRNGSVDVGAFTLVDFHNPNTPGSTRIATTSNVGGRTIDGTRFTEILAYEFSSFLEGNARLSFDAPVRAFGADFIANDPQDRVNLKVDGQSFVRSGSQNGFFGVVADAVFDTIVITLPLGRNGYLGFDNVTYSGSVGAVPEPASWAMMIAGFVLAGSSARRRQPRRALG